jgi:uncharacterized heparinase superfamily protein
MFTRALLYFNSIRHMTTRQVIDRLAVRSKRKILDLTRAGAILYRPPRPNAAAYMRTGDPLFPGLSRAISDPLGPDFEIAIRKAGQDLRSLRFPYVGEVAKYVDRVDWEDKRRARLWRLNLHYFDLAPFWVLDATINQNEETLSRWQWLADSWIRHNPIGQFEAWNPYCLSRRIPNWILAHQLAKQGGMAEDQFSSRLMCSLYRQASYLYSNVEWDLPMNHLTANGCALFYAGVFFEDKKSKRWLERGKELIWQRLEKDVCPDGGHAERSPMYHLLVLQDSLECYAISLNRGIAWPDKAVHKLRKMVDFSEAIEHPDGEIPLFNDAAFGIAPKSCDLVSMARKILDSGPGANTAFVRPRFLLNVALGTPDYGHETPARGLNRRFQEFPESGYYVISNSRRDMKMVFDCGEVGIQQVAGHAHSDLLSYELSVAGERFVVDSGTSVYASGTRRQFERSISAHNTVSVDCKDTCEPWGDYRLARRGHPGVVRTFDHDGFVIIDAGHESFIGLRGIRHRRSIMSTEDILVVFDRILGTGTHSVESRLLLHPDINLEMPYSQNPAFIASGKTASVFIQCFGAETSVQPASDDQLIGWYAPRFGELHPSMLVGMRSKGRLPILIGHVIYPCDAKVEISVSDDTWEIELRGERHAAKIFLGHHGLRMSGDSTIDYRWV